MKLKELKVEALRLMFANADDILTSEDFGVYTNDEKYKIYLDAMNGAINRCLNDIKQRRVNDTITLDIPSDKLMPMGKYMYSVFLGGLTPKVLEVKRLVAIDKYGKFNPNVNFHMIGNSIIFENDGAKTYTLEYYEDLPVITETSDNEQELRISSDIMALIPYYIKGDVFRDDEPSEASVARNFYESGMEAIKANRVTKAQAQDMVDLVFNMEWM